MLAATGGVRGNFELWPLHTLHVACCMFVFRIGRRHPNKNLLTSLITRAECCASYAIIRIRWQCCFQTTDHVPFACSPAACGLHVGDLVITSSVLVAVLQVISGWTVAPLAFLLCMFGTRNCGENGHSYFYRLDALPVYHPTMPKHWPHPVNVSRLLCSFLAHSRTSDQRICG